MDDREFISQSIVTNSSLNLSQYPVEIKHLMNGVNRPNSKAIHESATQRHTQHNPEDVVKQQLYRQHHLLLDYNNPGAFDGKVRNVPKSGADQDDDNIFTGPVNHTQSSSTTGNVTRGREHNQTATPHPNAMDSLDGYNSSNVDSHHQTGYNQHNQNRYESGNPLLLLSNGEYSNALFITISIGCGLLLFNVLIFATLCYQLNKNRKISQQQFNNGYEDKDTTSRRNSDVRLFMFYGSTFIEFYFRRKTLKTIDRESTRPFWIRRVQAVCNIQHRPTNNTVQSTTDYNWVRIQEWGRVQPTLRLPRPNKTSWSCPVGAR